MFMVTGQDFQDGEDDENGEALTSHGLDREHSEAAPIFDSDDSLICLHCRRDPRLSLLLLADQRGTLNPKP